MDVALFGSWLCLFFFVCFCLFWSLPLTLSFVGFETLKKTQTTEIGNVRCLLLCFKLKIKQSAGFCMGRLACACGGHRGWFWFRSDAIHSTSSSRRPAEAHTNNEAVVLAIVVALLNRVSLISSSGSSSCCRRCCCCTPHKYIKKVVLFSLAPRISHF